MKKLLFLLASAIIFIYTCVPCHAQVKICALPTTTASATGDWLIKEDASCANGTKKISVGNFISSNNLNTYTTTPLFQGTNTYTANTVISPTGTFSLSSTGLTTIGSPSFAITGTTYISANKDIRFGAGTSYIDQTNASYTNALYLYGAGGVYLYAAEYSPTRYTKFLCGGSTASGGMEASSTYTTFAGIQYSAATSTVVATNQTGTSLLDRNANDARYTLTGILSRSQDAGNQPIYNILELDDELTNKSISLNDRKCYNSSVIETIDWGTQTMATGWSIPANYAVNTPTTTQTVTLSSQTFNIINPSGTIAALTLKFPNSPVSGDYVEVKFDQIVTTVTYSAGSGGATINGQVNALLGDYKKWVYYSATNTWY